MQYLFLDFYKRTTFKPIFHFTKNYQNYIHHWFLIIYKNYDLHAYLFIYYSK